MPSGVNNPSRALYYLPGFGGELGKGLGLEVSKRGYDVCGRETLGDFKALTFQQKIDTIANDLDTNFWYEDAQVIANSYGAYLFLHAQTQLRPFVGRLLLLSPIVGDFNTIGGRVGFAPPRAEVLIELAQCNRFPIPLNAEIHVGSEDWQSNPANVTTFGSMLGIDVTVVPNAGHRLPKEYVGNLLDKWLN